MATVQSAILALKASGGGDTPETVYSGVINALQGNGIGLWRERAYKVIFLMGDAPPLDPEPFTGIIFIVFARFECFLLKCVF